MCWIVFVIVVNIDCLEQSVNHSTASTENQLTDSEQLKCDVLKVPTNSSKRQYKVYTI